MSQGPIVLHFVMDQRGAPAIYEAPNAERPQPGFRGRLYVATDAPFSLQRDTGVSWDIIAGGGITPTNAWVQGGNDFGADGVLGLTSANNMAFITNNTPWWMIDTNGLLFTAGNATTFSQDGTTQLAQLGAAPITIDGTSGDVQSNNWEILGMGSATFKEELMIGIGANQIDINLGNINGANFIIKQDGGASFALAATSSAQIDINGSTGDITSTHWGIGGSAGDATFADNTLSIDPNGTVTGDFPGGGLWFINSAGDQASFGNTLVKTLTLSDVLTLASTGRSMQWRQSSTAPATSIIALPTTVYGGPAALLAAPDAWLPVTTPAGVDGAVPFYIV